MVLRWRKVATHSRKIEMSTDRVIKGTPVHYDDEGRPVSPRFADAVQIQADYLGYTEQIAEDLVSCICTSETFFHLRWGYFNDEPAFDDGKTLCGRSRGPDKEGFWFSASGHCCDCDLEMRVVVSDIGEDCGWIKGGD